MNGKSITELINTQISLKSIMLLTCGFFGLMYLQIRLLHRDTMNFLLKPGRSGTPDKTPYQNLWAGDLPREAEEILDILNYPEVYDKFYDEVPMGILLAGIPGTGKTHFARMVAQLTKAAFFSAAGSQFDELYVGRGAQRVRRIFDEARSYTRPGLMDIIYSYLGKKPIQRKAVIFIDEIDAVGSRNSLIDHNPTHATVSQLLIELDGINSSDHILVIAATNNINQVDPALKRSGRFNRIIQMSMPSLDSRIDLIKFYLKKPKMELIISDKEIKEIAEQMVNFSAADIKAVVDESTLIPVRKQIDIKKKDPKNFNESTMDIRITKEILEEAYNVVKKKISMEKNTKHQN